MISPVLGFSTGKDSRVSDATQRPLTKFRTACTAVAVDIAVSVDIAVAIGVDVHVRVRVDVSVRVRVDVSVGIRVQAVSATIAQP